MTSVTTGITKCSPAALEHFEPMAPEPLETVGACPGFVEHHLAEYWRRQDQDPARQNRKAELRPRSAARAAITARWPPPILTPLTSKTEAFLMKLTAGEFERLEDRKNAARLPGSPGAARPEAWSRRR